MEKASSVVKEVLKIEKSNGTVLKASVSQFNGYRYLDIREWFKNEGSEDWKPTKKGITLKRDVFEPLIEALWANKDKVMELLEEAESNQGNA